MLTSLIKRIARQLDTSGIHKMVAGRAVDLEDVGHLIAKNRKELDVSYLRRWLVEFSGLPEHASVLADFERLLSQ